MRQFHYLKISTVIALALLAVGCAMPQMSITDLEEVSPDHVVYFGRVQLSPRLSKDEVVYKNVINLSDQELHKVLYLKASDAYYDLGGGHAMDFGGSLATNDGEFYFYSWDKESPFIILGVSFITHWSSSNRETMTLRINDGIKAKHSGKSRAVYIGDITFVRDEFFNIKDIKIDQSGYKAAKREFKKRFHQQWKTEKAVLTAAR